MIPPEYQTRTLTPSQSTSSVGNRSLLPSESGNSLMRAAAGQKMGHPHISPGLHGGVPRNLGQSASATSLLSVESDSSAPAPVAPPRSAQLNTGEVLQPYAPSQLQATGSSLMVPPTVASQVQSVQQGPSQPRRGPHHSPGMNQSPVGQGGGQPLMHAHSVGPGMVQSQAVIHREPSTPVPAQEPPPPQQATDSQSTWVIEEVIDFGVPLDEGMMRECDDGGYPLCGKNLEIGQSHRGNVELFQGCTHNLCYDEQDFHDRRDGKDLC